MDSITIHPLAGGDDLDNVIELCIGYRQTNGRLPLSDQSWIEINSKRRATGGNPPVGYVARNSQNGDIMAYLHLSPDKAGSVIEVVVKSDLAGGEDIARELIVRCVANLAPEEYPLYLWVSDLNRYLSRVAESLGMSKHRELYQMRKPLGILVSNQTGADDVYDVSLQELDISNRGLSFGTFQPGKDESSWLEMNNRCFVGHPDQSDWTIDDLVAREDEPWFDPQGFILCEYEGHIAGSCWTKIHPATEPDGQPAGEIYVICTDPAYQGKGIGGLLLKRALDYFEQRCLPAAMLYVESTNEAALALYRRYGFSIYSTDTQYVLELA